jgi:hypothetical protein
MKCKPRCEPKGFVTDAAGGGRHLDSKLARAARPVPADLSKEYLMRKVTFLIVITSLFMLTGCAFSLQPLYTEEDLSFDPALLGIWVDETGHTSWEFTKESETDYRLVTTETRPEWDHSKKGEFEVHLVKLDGVMFLDFFPAEMESPHNNSYMLHFLPVHTFVRVIQIGPTLIYGELTEWDRGSWLIEYLENYPTAIKHEKVEGYILLTAPPKELQDFLLAHLEDGFKDQVELERQEQETTPAGK